MKSSVISVPRAGSGLQEVESGLQVLVAAYAALASGNSFTKDFK